MATKIDTGRLTGFFKDRFGDDASALPTEGYDVLQQRIKFNDALMLGEKISQPVQVQHSTGWTFAGGATTGTMFALNDPNSANTVEATWTSQEFVIRERTSWKALRAAQTNKQAFANSYDRIVRDMRDSAVYACEFSMLYGGSHLGQIESQTGSSTTRTWVLSKASSTAGLWWKMQGARMDVYTAYAGTKHNALEDVVITSADIADATGKVSLSVSGNATDLSAIDTAISSSTAVLIPKGADGNMMVGIDAIATNTGSYAGINATTYPLWRSTSLNASSAGATFSKIMQALKRNRLKSGPGMRTALISEATAHDINDNVTALQRLDKGGGKFELGVDSVVYTGPSGSVEFMPHVLMKEGEAFLLDLNRFERIGSTDFTFDPSGKGEYFEHVSGFAGLELVGYWDQSIKTDGPGSITKITSIVNTF